MDRANSKWIWLHISISSFIIICWMKTSLCWKLDNDNVLYTNRDITKCALNTMCICFPNETHLLQISCNEITSMYKIPEILLGTVKYLEITHTKIQQLDDDSFQGLRLESLKLIDNRLYDISEKSLSAMIHSLISLDISGNLFQSLPLKSISNIHTLSRLVAQRNYIHHLDDDNWGVLQNSLRVLHLADNSISEITKDHYSNLTSESFRPKQHGKDFSNLHKLVWLDLSSNRIHRIHGAYALPKSIVTLDFSTNLISEFPISVQIHLRDLRILYMRDNLLSNLDNISFKGLRSHLEKIDVSQNRIFKISENLFNQSTIVKALNLDRNFLTHLPSNAFKFLKCVHLILSYNYITEIDENAFATLENSLEYLDLERNFLKRIPRAILNLAKINYLYLTSNLISDVEFLPSTLKVISLSSNNFSHIPRALANTKSLRYLNMGYNQITHIEPQTFLGWGKDLQTLLLRNNKIGNITIGALAGLDSLKEISLAFNDIHFLHPQLFVDVSKTLNILELSFTLLNDDIQIDFYNLSSLMWLSIDNNNLKTIENNSLVTLHELTYINLSFNRLISIPIDFFIKETHKNLAEIDLSFNLIEKIKAHTFRSLFSLQIINLSSNKIQCLEPKAFFNLPALSFLDLSYNKLRSLSTPAFVLLPNFSKINLENNHNLEFFSLKAFQHVSNASAPMSINIGNNTLKNFDGESTSHHYIYSLDLSNNYLSDLKPFKNISSYSLCVLYLNSNNISVLNNHAFGNFHLLEILNLARNKIMVLRRQSLYGLINLQELDFSHNLIDFINDEQFSNLLQLRYLKLNNNRLKTLPREVFANTKLEFIDLSQNLLNSWPHTSFSDVGFTLRTVFINHNFLDYLDATIFLNTLYLTELKIASNQIKILPENTFSVVRNLSSLDLSENRELGQSTNFKELFLNARQLRFLNLRSTGLTKIPPLYLDKLIELDISENHISELDLQFSKLTHLRKLKVRENQINNLTHFMKRLPPLLLHLDISKNPIRKLESSDFISVKRLQELEIENVKISNSNGFASMHNLKTLRMNLEHNINDVISQLHGLSKLYVTVYDHIRLDGRFFGKLLPNTKLNYIEITGHKLKSIAPNAFNGLLRNVNLKICIRNTMISSLPTNLFYPPSRLIPKLTVELVDNKLLSRLGGDVFYPNASTWQKYGTRNYIGGIIIEGQHSIACTCDNVWLSYFQRKWLREKMQVELISKDEYLKMLKRARKSTCVDMRNENRATFLELFSEDLLCHASALSSLGLKLKINCFYFLATIAKILFSSCLLRFIYSL